MLARPTAPNRRSWPGRPVGSFAIRSGTFFAATDQFEITIEGKGGHAAKPQETIDPTVTAAQMVLALQTVASRNADPVGQIVVVEPVAEKREAALRFGADVVIDPNTQSVVTEALTLSGGIGYDAVIEASGDRKSAAARMRPSS